MISYIIKKIGYNTQRKWKWKKKKQTRPDLINLWSKSTDSAYNRFSMYRSRLGWLPCTRCWFKDTYQIKHSAYYAHTRSSTAQNIVLSKIPLKIPYLLITTTNMRLANFLNGMPYIEYATWLCLLHSIYWNIFVIVEILRETKFLSSFMP